MNAPSDFTMEPWDSVLHKTEAEVVAVNVMVILKRTGNTWRDLTWDEYKKERLKDGNFSDIEQGYFTQVIRFCRSEIGARLFSPGWAEVAERPSVLSPTSSRKRKILC
jgi:hypothetical protein